MPTQAVSPLPRGTMLSRLIISLAETRCVADAAAYAKQWRDSPDVEQTLIKAGTSPLSTTGPAAPLSAYGISSELIGLYRDAGVLGRLSSKMRKVPFRVDIARELGVGAGASWIPENSGFPVVALSFDSVRMESFKLGTIIAFSKELMRFSNPSAEAEIRSALVAGLTKFWDGQFLNPAVLRIAGANPAAVTSAGAGLVSSTGSTAAAIATDLASMLGQLETWGYPVWIMHPSTLGYLATRFPEISTLTAQNGILFGYPIICSVNSPQQITLLDANAIIVADEDGIELDSGTHATIQFDTTPTEPAGAPMTNKPTSLWQRGLVGVRCIREIAWLRGRDASVVSMSVPY